MPDMDVLYSELQEVRKLAEAALGVQEDCLAVLREIRDRLPPAPPPPGAT
jgi:hypothetical protein